MPRMRKLAFAFCLMVALGFAASYAQAQNIISRSAAAITLDHLDDSAVFKLNGSPYVDATIVGALSATMCVMAEFSTDNQVTWDERLEGNGDNWVACDNYPHPVENMRDMHFPVRPSDTHIRIRVLTWTSGSVTVSFATSATADPWMAVVASEEMKPATMNALNSVLDNVFPGRQRGQISSGFHIDAGTCVCTVVVESNATSHETTGWTNIIFFAGGQWWLSGMAMTSPSGATDISVPISAPMQRIRLRISAFTSGSFVARSRTTGAFDVIANQISAGITGVALPVPVFSTQVAGSDGTNLRTFTSKATQPASTDYAMAVRLAPNTVYSCYIPSQVHVASANTVQWDFFNADAALIVRVVSILQIPNITTAVTGVTFDWLLERETAVGTGGSALTPWLADLSQTALDADITCRSKPSGGATQSTDLRTYSLSSEETNTATIQIASQGGLELIPEPMRPVNGGQGIVLRTNQGIRDVQVTNSVEGNTGWLILFQVQ